MLSPAQQKLYWRLWGDCVAANRWYAPKGRLQFDPARLTEQGRIAAGHAAARARQQHRAMTADDLRHGCHIAALGRDCSMKELDNASFDRLLNVFRLVIDGEDLDAAERLVNPELGRRERLVHAIARMAPDAFVREIAGDRFGTRLWEDLDVEQLLSFRRLLSHTRYGRASQPLEEPELAAEVEQPF